jgi:nitroimidazol reductase NimA-like FMN-containing flavoprotein (pyridoxamine 5'-phosphate oxidase superfamily)
MLGWEWAAERLERAHNYWLATTSAGGAPHVRPVWALWMEGRLCFSTDAAGAKGRNIARDPRVSVNLDDGDEVVIVEGVAEPLEAELAAAVPEAYKRKYEWEVTVGDSGWYAIRPVRAYAWTEADFTNNVTRFDF